MIVTMIGFSFVVTAVSSYAPIIQVLSALVKHKLDIIYRKIEIVISRYVVSTYVVGGSPA